MPEFSYQAKKLDGGRVEGVLDAKDRSDALRKLSSSGLQPFSISAKGGVDEETAIDRSAGGRKGAGSGFSGSNQGKISLKSSQVILFTEELSDLLGAGVQLEQSLKLMEGRGDLSSLGELAHRTRELVRDGEGFAKALETASDSFGPLYCNLVRAGEASGALPSILKRQVQYLVTMRELKSQVLTAMIYPAFLAVAGVAVTVLFITFLIPRLTVLIKSNGGEMPMGVEFIVGASDFLKAWWWLIGIVVALLLAGFKAFVNRPENRSWWDRVKLRIPLFGSLSQKRFHVQFLQTLGNLLGNGLTLVQSLELIKGITENEHLKSQIAGATEAVVDGANLNRALESSGIFPRSLVDLVRIGEETGQLTATLEKAGERFDRELARGIERVGALVQPMIILMMAGVIGTMAYLMITVIYDTIDILRSR